MKISQSAAAHFFRPAFTLVETVISASITSTALITALSLMTSGVSVTKESHQEVAAVLLARRVVGMAQKQTDAKDPTLHVEIFDAALQAVSRGGNTAWSANDYAAGVTEINAAYLVSWQLIAPAEDQSQTAKVKITVEAPASAIQKNRHSYTYATLVQR